MTPYRLSGDRTTRYGFGWVVTDWNGIRYQEHGGGIPGFVSYALRAPDQHLFVVVLSNGLGRDPAPSTVAPTIAGMALGKPIADPPIVPLPAADLDRFAGDSTASTRRTSRTISRDGDHLVIVRSGVGRRPLSSRPRPSSS